jgi:hypothetical protein
VVNAVANYAQHFQSGERTTILALPLCLKPKIINSLHSSKESLKVPSSRVSIRNKLAQKDAIDSTELVALNKDTAVTITSGKH